MEVYYRYDDGDGYSGSTFLRQSETSKRADIELTEFAVIKHTPKGVRLDCGKFVLSDPNGKRFAYAKKEDALASYIIRKKRQVAHATTTLANAQYFLSEAELLQDGTLMAPRRTHPVHLR